MDSIHEEHIGAIQLRTELAGQDSLAVLLKRLRLEGPQTQTPARTLLEKQARTILERITYLHGDLALIEVDGVSNAVQIRSKKPGATGTRFVEILLRNGNVVTVEAHGAPLLVSRENYRRLIEDLSGLL